MNEHGQIANEKHEKKEFSDFCEQVLFRKFNEVLVFAGSCFELPLIYFLETVTDVDSIVYQRNVCAIEKHDETPKDFKGTVLNSRSDESHHGYARLYSETNNTPYTYALVPDQMPALSQVLLEKSEFATGLFPVSSYMGKWLTNFQGLYRDIVDAIWCPNWPKEANEWKFRERRTGWPFSCTVEEIVNNGCFLVAKPHVYDMDGQSVGNEWRFSFSEAELILIYTWDHVQMYIYHILRLIKSDVVKKCGGKKMTCLTTYHFKTLMLWACEEKPKEFWLPPNIKSSAEELLLIMIEWLVEKHCRNYFMPGNNMLDHLPDSHNFEREVQFLIESANVVDVYISNTVPFTEDPRHDLRQEFSVRIPTNLLLAMHLRTSYWHIIDLLTPGRQMYSPSKALEKSRLFRLDIFNLFHCLTLHRRLILAKDLKTKVNGLHEISASFQLANKNQVDGFTRVDISPMDNFHAILTKLLRMNIDGSDSCDYQTADSTLLHHRSAQRELCYNRIELLGQRFHVASVAESFFNMLNEQIPKPSCFHTAAYEANYYWTIFRDEGNDMHAESCRRALKICEKWLSCAKKIRGSFSFFMFYGEKELPIIISNRWSVIFDKYIQIVFGFMSLFNVKVNRGFHSDYSKTMNATNDFDPFRLHVYPIDFLGYIWYQCKCYLRQFLVLDDSFTSEMQNDMSRLLLYTAARISTWTDHSDFTSNECY